MPSSAQLKFEDRYQLAGDENLAGARSLTELQLIIYRHKEMVQWIKCKTRLALVGYPLAESKLPTSWACLLSQLWLKLEAWPRCSLESTGTGVGVGGGGGGWMKCKIILKLSQLGCSWQLGLQLGLS